MSMYMYHVSKNTSRTIVHKTEPLISLFWRQDLHCKCLASPERSAKIARQIEPPISYF